jgi:EAL domain-containing protein (putative c-di-GMP-specific phosphodiesterase class I)/FixJ family two-component response regulator
MHNTGNPRILWVDDDQEVLDAVAPHLALRYQLDLATGGADGLHALALHPETAVILSDLRMPGMNGAAFLAASRALAPDARRVLLTGCVEMPAAIAAINEGQICRFLTKPSSPQTIIEAVEFALSEYRAEMANRSAIRQFAARDVLGEDRVTGLASRERLLETLGGVMLERQLVGDSAGTVYLLQVRFIPPFADNVDSVQIDQWIRAIAAQLKLRAGTGSVIARWDKQFFAVFEHGQQPDRRARGLELLESLTASWEIGSVCVTTDVSVGIVSISSGALEPQLVMGHAELAEQESRGLPYPKLSCYTPETGAKAEYRRELMSSLRRAIANDELELYYQPIVDIGANRIHSLEALARWSHPRFGTIAPSIFIPLAEAAGLIVPLGNWVLRRACRDGRRLLELGFPRIALNVSVRQLADQGFLYSLYLALEESGLPASALEIEVTESVFAQDLDQVRAILADVRAIGIGVAIDDFGTGYSSLSYLAELPVDIVKIDGAFMRNFDHGGEAIIDATIAVAEKLKLDTILEGVETAAMLENARAVGATLVQGYHLAAPMALTALGPWAEAYAASPLSGPHRPLRLANGE